MLLLIAVLFAPPLNNSRRWIFLAGLSVQPSELAKIAVVLFLAYQIDKKVDRVNQPRGAGALRLDGGAHRGAGPARARPRHRRPPGLDRRPPALPRRPLLALRRWWRPASRCRRSGSSSSRCRYRRERFFSFLDPEQDPLGSGFQVLQSMIAVGSGGPWGLGLGGSVQKLHFLPLAESDFIYSILAEELGLIGARRRRGAVRRLLPARRARRQPRARELRASSWRGGSPR